MTLLGCPVLVLTDKYPLALPLEAELAPLHPGIPLPSSLFGSARGPLAEIGRIGERKLGVMPGCLPVRSPKVSGLLKDSYFPWLSTCSGQCSSMHPCACTTPVVLLPAAHICSFSTLVNELSLNYPNLNAAGTLTGTF